MKAYRNSLIFWSVGIFFMVASGMAKYSAAIGGGDKSINDLMKTMPKAVQSIVGAGDFDLTIAVGYYGMLFLYLVMMATIHAAMLGADIISKEEADKTSEFLFVKPKSRNQIITQKLLAALVNIVVFNIVTIVFSLIMVSKYSKGEPFVGNIMILMAGMFVLQVMFLFIGSAIAAISKNPKVPTSITTGILLSTFILSVAIDINDKLESLRWFTPFKYFDAKNLMNDGRFDLAYTVLSVLIIGIAIASTYVFYKKRDLNI